MHTKNRTRDTLIFGDDRVHVEYNKWDNTGYGLVILTAPDEYIIAGITARITFGKKDPSKSIRLGAVPEGKLEGEKWVTTRM